MMASKNGPIGVYDDDYYITKEERDTILGHIRYDPPCTMFPNHILEKLMQKRGFIIEGKLSDMFPSILVDVSFTMVNHTRMLISQTMFDRLKIDCVVEQGANPFFLARATKHEHELKVMFPKKNLIKSAKSHAVVLNRFYELCAEKFIEFDLVPVIVEGDFDAWATLHMESKKLYVGVGILGKHLSSTQLNIIKNLSTTREEIVLCLDGLYKSPSRKEEKLMKTVKSHTIERLTGFYACVRSIELGLHDPNSAYLENKDWFRMALDSSKCYY